MKNRTWIRPAVSAAAALAVGVAGVLVGTRFAPPHVVEVPRDTVTAPVLAPIAVGDDLPAALAEAIQDGGDIPVSPVAAEREIAPPSGGHPTDPTALDPALADLLDVLAHAADPVIELMELDAEADWHLPVLDDDPCAPREGSPPADCPDGLRSTVLAVRDLVDFRHGGQAYPPTLEEYREHGNPAGGSLWCDGLAATETAVPFGIVSTAPGFFRIRYWQTETGTGTGVATVTTDPAERDAYLAAVEAGRDPLEAGFLRHCFTLDGLAADTRYTAVIDGADEFGRLFTGSPVYFHTGGAPIRPGAVITPVGENLVLVTAPHTAYESVEARVVLLDDVGEPTCAIGPGAPRISALADVEVELSREEVAARNWLPQYQRTRVQTFGVPEGATVLVCVRWYNASGPGRHVPSWLTEQPVFESSAILQSPDRLSPRLTVESIVAIDPGLESVEVAAGTPAGGSCGAAVLWRHAEPGGLPRDVCGPGSFAGGDLSWTDDRREGVREATFSGTLVATITTTRSDGRTGELLVVLPGRDRGCRGECRTPEPEWYTVDVRGATVALKMSWEQGRSNGRSEWWATPTVDVAPEYRRPDTPQLDRSQRWRVTTTPHVNATSVPVAYDLVADRPVDYTVRLTTLDEPGVGAPGCTPDRAPLETSGRAEGGRATVAFDGACVGRGYYAEIELADDDGDTVTWGWFDRSAWLGEAAVLRVPGVAVDVRYDLRAQHFMGSWVSVARVWVGPHAADLTRTMDDQCDADGVVHGAGTLRTELADETMVRIELKIQTARQWSPGRCGYLEEESTRIVQRMLTLAELRNPLGVVIDAPDLYGARLVLQVTPAAG